MVNLSKQRIVIYFYFLVVFTLIFSFSFNAQGEKISGAAIVEIIKPVEKINWLTFNLILFAFLLSLAFAIFIIKHAYEIKKEIYNHNLKSILFVVVILLLITFFSFAIYFGNDNIKNNKISKDTFEVLAEENPIVEEIKDSLEITELKFCNFINEYFICEENIDNKFNITSSVYVYFNVENLKEKNGKVNYRQSLEVTDPNLNIVKPISKVWLEKEEDYEYLFSFYNEIITDNSDIPGNYIVNITILDKNSNEEVKKSSSFNLK